MFWVLLTLQNEKLKKKLIVKFYSILKLLEKEFKENAKMELLKMLVQKSKS